MSNFLVMIDEDNASNRVSPVYEEIKKEFQIDFVPNFFKAQASTPHLLEATWAMVKTILLRGVLPRLLKEKIFIAVSQRANCVYCQSAHLALCKVLGTDGETLRMLSKNIEGILPKRDMYIIKFAIMFSDREKNVVHEGYPLLVSLGLSTDEINEIIAMVGLVNYCNTVAESLMVPVDEQFVSALEQESIRL